MHSWSGYAQTSADGTGEGRIAQPGWDSRCDARRAAQPLIETPQQVRCMTAPVHIGFVLILRGRFQGAVRTTSVR
ncbi:hypothetical protein GLA29479_2370 [Lysobacter antibioticus]|uniref:Uncharacterized protein n=1 Tax=Lysobacter antibioticus TaxID=84531 RepID=A0A0S2DXQ2_LYSAN|nr:hypothetical protein GLA29479_2370 [Lysobacter antibioticus]ALN81463.1 hypothetical protein LA76x_3337 [Lysobacter antibioticus]